MSEATTTPNDATVAEPVAGVLAQFDAPGAVRAAAADVRDAGFVRWDVHSPFPVHGIERSMGVRRTVLPWLVLGAGITGFFVALGLQWWTNAYDYPYLISGKPFFSLPANVPVMFELIVLFSALTAFFGNLVLNRLPQFSHPAVAAERFKQVTNDGFFIWVDGSDAAFEEPAVVSLLESAGATAVEVCRKPAAEAKLPSVVAWGVIVVATLAVLPPLLTAWYRAVPKRSPRIHVVPDMDFQPKYLAQGPGAFFADRRAMRSQVEGTVAVGELREDDHFYRGRSSDGGWATRLPMPATGELIERGRERYDIYCAVCHGFDGAGAGIVSQRALKRLEPDWATPVSFHSNSVREQADGQIFNTITVGTEKMPGYAAQIEPADRWAIVLYVRAMQLSQNATVEDVPQEFLEKLE